MTYQEVDARHAAEKKLLEVCSLLDEMCRDLEPDVEFINVSISKNGQTSLYTSGNEIDVTRFPDGQIYYTTDWDRMLGRTRKETDHESV